MLGFDPTGLTIVNYPAYLLAGFLIGIGTCVVRIAVSAKQNFSLSSWFAAPVSIVAVVSWHQGDPGWLPALSSVFGYFCGALIVVGIQTLKLPVRLAEITVVLGLIFILSQLLSTALEWEAPPFRAVSSH